MTTIGGARYGAEGLTLDAVDNAVRAFGTDALTERTVTDMIVRIRELEAASSVEQVYPRGCLNGTGRTVAFEHPATDGGWEVGGGEEKKP